MVGAMVGATLEDRTVIATVGAGSGCTALVSVLIDTVTSEVADANTPRRPTKRVEAAVAPGAMVSVSSFSVSDDEPACV
jgi:hypothetical protein